MATNNRYQTMEKYMTRILLGDLCLFILFLIFAGIGVAWLKVILAIIAILTSILCLGYLYLTQELLKKRSLWMSVSAAAILVCILFSLILNFPSPNPYKQPQATETAAQIIQMR